MNLEDIPSEFSIYPCDDLGPATKLLPTVARYRNTDTTIIYCDDDKLYDKNWVLRLLKTAERHPRSAVCDEAFSISSYVKKYNFKRLGKASRILHRLKFLLSMRQLSQLKYQPPYICGGFGGVLVKPAMIGSVIDFVPSEVYFVDDIYFSGLIYANGYDIIKTRNKKNQRRNILGMDNEDIGGSNDALKNLIHEGLGRQDLNLNAMRYMAQNYQIWQEIDWNII